MSMTENIILLAQAVGEDISQLITNQGNLSSLTTTQKSNLVGALNELREKIVTVENTANSSVKIDDQTASSSKTYSSSKIDDLIHAAVSNIIDGAPEAYDTLKEIADYISEDSTATSALTEAIGKRVRFDAAQSLSAAQKLQACQNIGVGDPSKNFLSTYEVAKGD